MSATLDVFAPLFDAASGLDLSAPAAACAELEQRFDPTGEAAAELRTQLIALLDEGAIADRGEMPVKWGRVAKASPDSRDFSIDVVLMNGAGPRHRHPKGEVNYCIALEGTPTFEDQAPGWVVMAPESIHVPTVAGGTMLIVYLLPDGEADFNPA